MPNDERNLETLPDGALGLIPLESCKELGLKVDKYLVGWREKDSISMHLILPLKITAAILTSSLPLFRVLEPAKQRCDQRVCPWIRSVPDGRCDKLQSYLLRMRP